MLSTCVSRQSHGKNDEIQPQGRDGSCGKSIMSIIQSTSSHDRYFIPLEFIPVLFVTFRMPHFFNESLLFFIPTFSVTRTHRKITTTTPVNIPVAGEAPAPATRLYFLPRKMKSITTLTTVMITKIPMPHHRKKRKLPLPPSVNHPDPPRFAAR